MSQQELVAAVMGATEKKLASEKGVMNGVKAEKFDRQYGSCSG